MANEAVRVGPAPASESYLDMEAILKAIEQTGAQAVSGKKCSVWGKRDTTLSHSGMLAVDDIPYSRKIWRGI